MKASAQVRPMFRKLSEDQRDRLFRAIEFLGKHGLHGWKIAEFCGISVGQVYQACAKLQIRLKDYRDGRNETAKQVLVSAPRVNVLMVKKGGEVALRKSV